MNYFKNAKFFTTVNHLQDLPDTPAEIAFVGRSNAGKSSAINTLTQHTRLAYVSKTPGRTQHINFFRTEKRRFHGGFTRLRLRTSPRSHPHPLDTTARRVFATEKPTHRADSDYGRTPSAKRLGHPYAGLFSHHRPSCPHLAVESR